DHWLKDIDTGLLDEPPISLFVMGRNEWRSEREWPLPGTEFTPFFLHSNGRANTLDGNGVLSREPPAGEAADRYVYDPADPVPTIGGNHSILTLLQHADRHVVPGPLHQRPLDERHDVLCYAAAPFDKELE